MNNKHTKKLFFRLSIYFFTIFFFVIPLFYQFNHLLFLNSFTEINSRIPGGIKLSIEEGITSYGLFEVGYKSLDKSLDGQSINNNIYKATRDINVRYLETGLIEENTKLISYQKKNGFYTRLLPYFVYQISSTFSPKYIYLELIYIIFSVFSFLKIFSAIVKKYSYLHGLIFYFLFISNSYFILNIRSIIAPFIFSIWILFLLTFKKIRTQLIIKQKIHLLFILFLPPTLISNTLGPLVFGSFLTGLYLFADNFSIFKNKLLIFKALLVNLSIFIFNEISWMLQRIYFLEDNYSELVKVIRFSFGKYYKSLNTGNLNSCSNITTIDYINIFSKVKMSDFLLFEISLIQYIGLFLAIIFVISKKQKNSFKNLIFENSHIFLILFLNFLWFLLIKGAFVCHLHVYPRYFLLSLIPIFISFNTTKKELNKEKFL